VAGLSAAASRALLDRLEAHVLRRRFRCGHAHAAGDATIRFWHNYMTVRSAPPSRQGARNRGDARPMQGPARAAPSVRGTPGLAGHARGHGRHGRPRRSKRSMVCQ
jgi:hypothetical protein